MSTDATDGHGIDLERNADDADRTDWRRFDFRYHSHQVAAGNSPERQVEEEYGTNRCKGRRSDTVIYSKMEILMAQKMERIEANSLVIKDSKGNAMITMGVDEYEDGSYPAIELYDPKTGLCRVSIGIDPSGPFAFLRRENGQSPAANMRYFNDGTSVCGAYGRDERHYAAIRVDINGEAGVEVRDKEGKIIFEEPHYE